MNHCTFPPVIQEDVNPCQHFVFLIIFNIITTILTGIKWYLIVVLICVYLTVNHMGHLFMCLLVTHIQFLEIRLFKFFAHFVIYDLFLNYKSSLYILDNNLLTICMI